MDVEASCVKSVGRSVGGVQWRYCSEKRESHRCIICRRKVKQLAVSDIGKFGCGG